MNFNLAVDQFKGKLIRACNESGLPVKAVEMVLRELYADISRQAAIVVENERRVADEEKQKQSEHSDK